jgi:hypothetical protein
LASDDLVTQRSRHAIRAAMTDAAFIKQFCSLGNNCEFGAAQRRLGAEPADLLRWSGVDANDVIRMLHTQFDGIDDGAAMGLEKHPDGNVMGWHERCRFLWHAHMTPEVDVEIEALRTREVKRLRRLAEKLGSELAEASRIFVIKPSNWHGMGVEEAREILAAMRSFGGDPTLMFVHDGAQHPTLEVIEPNLLHGIVPKFAPEEDVIQQTREADWLTLCRMAIGVAKFNPDGLDPA